jgi:hypothetical protein
MRHYKKMGLLFMAVIIALAGLGVGFAAWTDKITLHGTVETGDVDLEVIDYSGTWVFKVPGLSGAPDYEFGNETYVTRIPDDPELPEGAILIAWAEAFEGNHDPYDVEMVWSNLFPCIDFTADVVFHYDGSIPVKVNSVIFNWLNLPQPDEFGPTLEPTFDATARYLGKLQADGTIMPIPGKTGGIVDIGYQLHRCDVVGLDVTVHIPQDNWWMNKTFEAEAAIEVIQWNEFGLEL